MKKNIYIIVAFSLILMILTTSPFFLFAQGRLAAELTFTKNTAEDYVSVNGERAVSGRSILSPSEIITSAQANAKIVIPQTGTVLVSPNTAINLNFVSGGISGSLTSGEITVQSSANTSLNLQTPDGTVVFPAQNNSNIVKISITNGATKIQTLVGQAKFNNVVVSAGEFYPVNSVAPVPATPAVSSGLNPLLLIGIIGAAAAVAVIALSASSDNNNGSPVVSPTR